LGDDRTVITEGTESLSRLLVKQESGWVTADLDYRVRAIETSSINVGVNVVSYVNIWIIQMKIDDYSEYVGDLDLTVKSNQITTLPMPSNDPYEIPDIDLFENNCKILVNIGNQSHEEYLTLTGNQVVFNFIISDVEISP